MVLHRFARNTMFSTAAGVATSASSLIGSVIVARLLGPSGAGAVALALWMVATAVTAGDLGIPLTLARFGPDLAARGQDEAGRALARSLTPTLLLTTGFGVLAALGAFALEWTPLAADLPFGRLPPFIWLAIAAVFVAQALGNLALGRLRGEQRFGETARLALASALLQIVAVAAGSFLFGIVGGLAGFAAGSLAPALRLFDRPRDQTPALDPALRQRAWRFSLHSWGAGLISTIVWSRSELAFLGYWRGPQDAGYYAAALTLTQIAIQAPLLMTGGLLALFAERQGAGDRAGLQSAYTGALRFMAAALLPASLGMAALVPTLVPLVFGPAFAGANGITIVLSAMSGIAALSTVATMFLFAVEEGRIVVQLGIWGAAMLGIAGVTIIPAFGLWGTAVTRVCVQFGLTVALMRAIERRQGIVFPWAPLLRIAGAAACCAVVAAAVATILPPGLGLVAAIGAGVLSYGVGLKAFRALTPDDVAPVAALAGRLPSRLRQPALRAILWISAAPVPPEPKGRSDKAQGVAGG